MKHFTIGRGALALVAAAVVCLSQAAIASAGGGNSANAKLCQKGGWQTLVRSDGSSFASQDDCVSYAAQGGTLVQESRSQIDCQSFGGTYATGTSPLLWTCANYTDTTIDVSGLNSATLGSDCTNEGGSLFRSFGVGGTTHSALCFR